MQSQIEMLKSEMLRNQQHSELEQSQEGSLPASRPFMMAAAHPTPGVTEMAENAQFWEQAPHSMQLSRSMIFALPPESSKTLCGQTFTHIPQPTHCSELSFKVTTFFKY